MAGSGKEAKDKKTPRDENNAASATAAALRKLSEDFAALRAEMEEMRAAAVPAASSPPAAAFPATPPPLPHPGEAAPPRVQTVVVTSGSTSTRQSTDPSLPAAGKNEARLEISYALHQTPAEGPIQNFSGASTNAGLDSILQADDATVARIGYAFSSIPKVALIRALIQGGPQSAAQLGAAAELTTGSLYHHLRELHHSGVLESSGRNRFALSRFGCLTAMLVFSQAGRAGAAGEDTEIGEE